MGCSSPNSIYSKLSTENKELSKFEQTWNVHKVPVNELELQIRRCQLNQVNDYIQLINSHFHLNIPENLLLDSKPTFEELLSLFILLGSGSPDTKLRGLWHIYDLSFTQKLNRSSLSRLIKSVIKSALNFSLKYYADSHKSALIIAWQQQLNERVESLSNKLIQHFLADKDETSLTEFLSKSQEMPQGRIFELNAVRTQLEHTQVIPARFANPFLAMKVKRLNS